MLGCTGRKSNLCSKREWKKNIRVWRKEVKGQKSLLTEQRGH
jgi:hypothetical protein